MIRLSSADRTAIEAHGAREYPLECCGVLLGDVIDGVKVVAEVRALDNSFEPSADFERSIEPARGSETGGGPLESSVDVTIQQPGTRNQQPATGYQLSATPPGQERRFMISPQTMFALMQEERRTKRKVVGFYHSHPDHPARPSEYDRAWAMPWYSYIIVSVRGGQPAEMTNWILADDGSRFDPEEIQTDIS
ncbi:MAG TPA: M67 family metallopeptidase [Chthonomonadaceae bacterium]|nr:M67 family metallopeptidase [Chthonomonadaceae bacterium]